MALILTVYTRSMTTERATANAASAVALVADFAISPVLTEADFAADDIDSQRTEELDAKFQSFIGEDILRIKVWDATGRVIYSDDRASVGQLFPVSHELEDALKGRTSSEVSEDDELEGSEREFGRLLEVYAPISLTDGDGFVGAFELYLPFEPVAESIAADTRRILFMLAGTLVLLYLALARVVVVWARTDKRADDSEHDANHDPLTGLANRRRFQAMLESSLDGEPGTLVAVLFIDLDDFKPVNDSHGHAVGDDLLVAVAGRFTNELRSGATLARLGGDEFAVLIDDVGSPANASDIALRLIGCLDAPIRLGDLRVNVHASIGIDVMSVDVLDPKMIQRRADAAMYMAKGAGKGQHVVFDSVQQGHLYGGLSRSPAESDA